MAWTFVGVSAAATVTGTPLTLTEPAGVAAGDLLIACIAVRTTSLTSIVNTGWTLVAEQKTNDIATTTSAIASGVMLYHVRGASAPDLTFTLPASGTSVCFGRMVAYRGNAATSPVDTSTAVTTAGNTTAVSVAGLTTTQADDLIVAMCAGGQEAAWSAFNNVTTPLTASGATDTTTAPSTTDWIERADSLTTTGADTSLAIFDAVRTAAGATGNLTATASLGAGHVVIAGAFKILVPPTADAWNKDDKSASITLSNSDKTLTTVSGAVGIRSTTAHPNETAGKYYAEFLLTTVTGGIISVGINNLTATLNVNTGPSCHIRADNGTVYINNTNQGNIVSSLVNGDIVSIAWDSGAEKIWFRVNGGDWDNNGTHNPGTNVGGYSCSFAAAVDHALWFSTSAGARVVTLRTETAEFTQSGPSGFTSWMGEALGAATTDGVGDADGVGAANADGAATKQTSSVTAAGIGTATAGGAATKGTAGTAAGVGAATGGGASTVIVAGDASAVGIGTAAAVGTVGDASVSATGNAPGIGTAAAGGAQTVVVAGAAPGVGSATAITRAIVSGAGAASSIATAAATGRQLATVTGVVSGIGAANASGAQIAAASGAASGLGSATAVVGGAGIGAATGLAPGVGAATATGGKIATTQGAASALGTAAASAAVFASGIGAAAGIGIATATGHKTAVASGAAIGLGTAAASGQQTAVTSGVAAGISAAAAASTAIGTAAGTATGIGAATATGVQAAVVFNEAAGAANGIGTTSGIGFAIQPSATPGERVTSLPFVARGAALPASMRGAAVAASRRTAAVPAHDRIAVVPRLNRAA